MSDLIKQACDCRDWSCGLPPCAECNEDHGGLERNDRRLCRDCWQDEAMNAIAAHEKANPGVLKKRVDELFGDKRKARP